MTNQEIQTIKYLAVLGLSSEKETSLQELKKQYLHFAKIYHPDTCSEEFKDGKKFSELKEAYDYLKHDINMTNEIIHNINHPESKTYNYYSENQSFIFNDYSNDFEGFKQNIIVEDKPSIFIIILCMLIPFIGLFMYYGTKASKAYATASMIGLFLVFFMMFL